jgi:hypothetical protein
MLAVRGDDVALYEQELTGVVQLSRSPFTFEQWEHLGGTAEAQRAAHDAIMLVRAQVMPLLRAIASDYSGEVVAGLRAHSAEYKLAFVGAAADLAQTAYDAFWQANHAIKLPAPNQTDILCYVAPAGMLTTENELSQQFPLGYRQIAQWLEPSTVWVAWKYVVPGETTGLSFNGLVWLNGRWVWFPKPYRVLGEAWAGIDSI